jgi:hypothetical protein
MSATPYAALTLITLASTLMFCFQTPTIVAFQNMVDSRMRASAAFIYLFTSAMIGIGAGPPLMGLSSDFFARRAFGAGNFALGCPGGKALPVAGTALVKACVAASAMGVRRALIAMAFVFLWAAAHYFVAVYVIRRDGGHAGVSADGLVS